MQSNSAIFELTLSSSFETLQSIGCQKAVKHSHLPNALNALDFLIQAPYQITSPRGLGKRPREEAVIGESKVVGIARE